MEWKRQKEVLKNVAFYPFIIRSSAKPVRRRTLSKQENFNESRATTLGADIEVVRARTLAEESFIIHLKMDQVKLRIMGEKRRSKEKKIIDIPKAEAMCFIEDECQGRLEGVFDRLSFDPQEDVLYLVGSRPDPALMTIHERRSQLESEAPRFE